MVLLSSDEAQLGSQAPDFSLPDLDTTAVSLGQLLEGSRGLVVAFICNHCPYVKAIVSDLVADAARLEAAGVRTVAIMPNDFVAYPSDNPEHMRAFAKQHAFGFPYLLDESQAVAKAYGAVCTPDFFGYDASGKLRYRGRLDNGDIKRPADREPELVNAMLAIAETGNAPAEQTRSIGCSIKWR